MNLRPALPDEAGLLSQLAMRSKAHWGYSPAFMAACEAELTFTPGYITNRRVYVAEEDGLVLGFYALASEGDAAELENLFVEPVAIGQGVGRRLWEHAVVAARSQGCQTLFVDSDPSAEAFYRRMGAERVGEVPSGSIPGRMLPRLRYHLA